MGGNASFSGCQNQKMILTYSIFVFQMFHRYCSSIVIVNTFGHDDHVKSHIIIGLVRNILNAPL